MSKQRVQRRDEGDTGTLAMPGAASGVVTGETVSYSDADDALDRADDEAPTEIASGPIVQLPPCDPVPCVGLPVQFHQNGDVIPGVLTRQGKIDPSTWELALFMPGAQMLSRRVGIKRSDESRSGFWTYLPGWRFTG